MNLSPAWVEEFAKHGIEAAHWSTIGDPKAPDVDIMDWARKLSYVVFTHDLDFGTTLALTHANGPSVIQIRGQRVLPDQVGQILASVLNRHETDLQAGALIVIDQAKQRVRTLPL